MPSDPKKEMFDESFFRLVFVHDDDIHVMKEKIETLEAMMGSLWSLLTQDQKNTVQIHVAQSGTTEEIPVRVLTDDEKKKLH